MEDSEFFKQMTDLLFIYRKIRNINLNELSDLVGIDVKFLNRLERGKHDTLISNYFKIAKYLNIPMDEMVKIINQYFKE